MKSKELREQLAKLVSDMRGILNAAQSEKRELTADENTNYQNIEKQVEKLEGDIERHETLEKREKEMSQTDPAENRSGGFGNKGGEKEKLNKRDAFKAYLRFGLSNLSMQQRDLIAGTNTSGGYLAVDEVFIEGLLKKLSDKVFIRRLARKYRIDGAKTGGIPTLESGFLDAEWTSEVSVGAADDLTFGKRLLNPSLLSKEVKISMLLLQLASEDPEALVQDELATIFAATEEKGFLTGSGSNQPLGLFTASSNGISTDRDVATDNGATAVTFDGLINAQEFVKDQYQEGCVWIGSRDLRKQARKLKDSENRYIWEVSTQVGAPNLLLGKPFYASEYSPRTFTSGLYVGVYGNLNYYGIADRMDLGVQRLDELYARSNKVGFIGRKETDGAPLLEEAFARVKLG